MHTIRIGNKTWLLPGSWEELSHRDTQRCAELSLAPRSPQTMAVALWHLMPRARKQLRQLDDYVLYQLASLLSWIWDSRPVEPTDDVHPMIAYFNWAGRRYCLPRHSLLDMTIEEWKYVDLYLQDMMEVDTREEALHGLVATICRPRRSWWQRMRPDYDGYYREYFNAETIERREINFRGLPNYVYVAVQDYVMRSAEMLRRRYEPVFEGPASNGVNFGYSGVEISVAEAGAFGRLSDVRRANIHDILLWAMKRELESRKQNSNTEAV